MAHPMSPGGGGDGHMIVDHCSNDWKLYLVQELCDGGTLSRVMESKALHPAAKPRMVGAGAVVLGAGLGPAGGRCDGKATWQARRGKAWKGWALAALQAALLWDVGMHRMHWPLAGTPPLLTLTVPLGHWSPPWVVSTQPAGSHARPLACSCAPRAAHPYSKTHTSTCAPKCPPPSPLILHPQDLIMSILADVAEAMVYIHSQVRRRRRGHGAGRGISQHRRCIHVHILSRRPASFFV